VFNVDKEEGLTLTEIADGVRVEDVIAATECIFAVSPDLKPMIQVSNEE
jgi:3-oxoacid CoA-transferase